MFNNFIHSLQYMCEKSQEINNYKFSDAEPVSTKQRTSQKRSKSKQRQGSGSRTINESCSGKGIDVQYLCFVFYNIYLSQIIFEYADERSNTDERRRENKWISYHHSVYQSGETPAITLILGIFYSVQPDPNSNEGIVKLKNPEPFIIGFYHGTDKPTDFETLVHPMLNELRRLEEEFESPSFCTASIRIEKADSLMRSYLKRTTLNTGN